MFWMINRAFVQSITIIIIIAWSIIDISSYNILKSLRQELSQRVHSQYKFVS